MNKWMLIGVVLLMAGCRAKREVTERESVSVVRDVAERVIDMTEVEKSEERRTLVVDVEEVERVLSEPDTLGRQYVKKETRRKMTGREVTERGVTEWDSLTVTGRDSVMVRRDEVVKMKEREPEENRKRWWWLLLVPAVYVAAKIVRRD